VLDMTARAWSRQGAVNIPLWLFWRLESHLRPDCETKSYSTVMVVSQGVTVLQELTASRATGADRTPPVIFVSRNPAPFGASRKRHRAAPGLAGQVPGGSECL
jgi:hypothetical protein